MKFFPLAVAALIAVPAAAQQTPTPAAPAQQAQKQAPGQAPRQAMGRHGHGPMFANMSAEGRKQLFAAMRSTAEERSATKAARDRINVLIAADTLDSAALRRAMDDERKLMDGQRSRRQAATLAAIEKLSTVDRKAFAESTSRARAQVEARTNNWRNRSMQNHGQQKAPPKD